MCLNRQTNEAKLYVTTEGKKLVGYKVFSIFNHNLNFELMGGRVRTNIWLKDKKRRKISDNRGRSYEVGYHIYLDFTKIRDDNYRKVYYKKPVAWGFQSGCPIVVAKELYVPSIRKR